MGSLKDIASSIGNFFQQFKPQSVYSDYRPQTPQVFNPQPAYAQAAQPSQQPMQPSPMSSPSISPIFNSQGLGRNPNLGDKPMTPQVQQIISKAAQEFQVNPQLLFDIAYSESGFRPDAKNESPEGIAAGIPTGLFQFKPGTWNNDLYNYAQNSKTTIRDLNPRVTPREDATANARAAAYLISHGQLGKWEASMPKWGQYYSDEELNPYFSQTPNWKGRQ